jgi:hypothetical protein
MSAPPPGSPPTHMWRPSATMPPSGSSLSVMSDPSPYSRRTPFGLMQDLHQFLGTRREAFYNHFMLAAAAPSSRSGSPPTRSSWAPGQGSHHSPTPGAISKAAAPSVVQRAAPGASDADTRYFALMLDAALPSHRFINLEVS